MVDVRSVLSSLLNADFSNSKSATSLFVFEKNDQIANGTRVDT